MMSNKKMKGVALDSSSYGHFEVSKARFKHQTLIQDFHELQKEADAMKNKLETMKLRKSTLLAEVRFLRRRYNYLVTAKHPKEQGLVQENNFQTRGKDAGKGKNHSRKDAKSRKVAPVIDVNKKEKVSIAKEYARRNKIPVLDLNSKDRIHSAKEASLRYRIPAVELNQKDRMYGGKQATFRNQTHTLDLNQRDSLHSGQETAHRNPPPSVDLNQMERTYVGRENVEHNRAPVFDLNQNLGEEESQDIYEPLRLEKLTKKSSGGGTDEQLNDLNLPIYRDLGNSSNRVGKRKISWQDQVALKV